MKLSSFEIKRHLLRKMTRHNWWGGKHTAYDDLTKGFPKELYKEVRNEINNLIKQGIIIEKSTGYGLHVSLNVEMKPEIEKIIFT